ncbi:transcription antitermination factor NusB [Rhodomicrobium vannielii]|uniref:transcription antitermination factor NusB n=1 Tax=Rhodomicrobium vannielii TaxID=1069 RepID=UPI003D7C1DA4
MASNPSDIPPPPPDGEARGLGARGTARLAAVQALYQMDLAQTDAAAVIGQFTLHRFGHEVDGAYYDRADEPLFRDLVLGVVRAQLAVDPLIAGNLAKGWKLARIDSIIRAILRAGAYELKERHDIPARVIINEYVDVAHAFFGGDEPGVVNGVLDAVARQVRAKDFTSPAHG